MRGKYPDEIDYFGQKITTKISMKTGEDPGFKKERQAMKALPSNHPDQNYLDTLEKQDFYKIIWSKRNETFIDYEGQMLTGTYNFIITCEDEPRILCGVLNHSFLANGKKVLAAGELIFQGNCLITMTNNSGHYRPKDEEMLAVIKSLYKMTKGSLLIYRSHCTSEPLEYPVCELIGAEYFAEVPAITREQCINTFTGNREVVVGYDTDDLLLGIPKLNRSFNRKLPLNTMLKYQKIIDSQLSLFSPEPPLDNEKEEPLVLLIDKFSMFSV